MRKPGRPGAVFAPVDPDPTPAELCSDGALSIPRAARFCGVPVGTMQKWVKGRLLASFVVGRRRVIARNELVRYLAAAMTASIQGRGKA